MDNIKIFRSWEDSDFLEIKVEAMSKFIHVYQMCYITSADLKEKGIEIKNYSLAPNQRLYTEFGDKTGNFTPAFSLEFFPIDSYGYAKIEIDIEIDDNDERKHRCQFYIESEIGLIQKFGENIEKFSEDERISEVELYY